MSRPDEPHGDEWGTRDTPWTAPPRRVRRPRGAPAVDGPAESPASRRRPPSHLVLAVLATAVSVPFLLGLPAGLVAIVSAVRVLRSGRRTPDLAEVLSERARRWGWLAVLLKLVVMLVQVLTSTPMSVFG